MHVYFLGKILMGIDLLIKFKLNVFKTNQYKCAYYVATYCYIYEGISWISYSFLNLFHCSKHIQNILAT